MKKPLKTIELVLRSTWKRWLASKQNHFCVVCGWFYKFGEVSDNFCLWKRGEQD
jgi:hypothetical protein